MKCRLTRILMFTFIPSIIYSQNWTKLHELTWPEGYPLFVQLSPDGRHLVVGVNALNGKAESSTSVLDVINGKEVLNLNVSSTDAKFSPDGNFIAVSSPHTFTKIFSFLTGKQVKELNGAGATTVQYSPDGKYLLTDRVLWEVAGLKILHEFKQGSGEVRFSPDSNYLTAIETDGPSNYISVWRLLTMDKIQTFRRGSAPIGTPEFNADGQTVLCTHQSGAYSIAIIWDVATAMGVVTFKNDLPAGPGSIVKHAKFSPDRTKLITTNDQMTKIWEATTGKLITEIRVGGFKAISPDNKQSIFVRSGFDENFDIKSELQIIEVETGKVLYTTLGDTYGDIKFSGNGKLAIAKTSKGLTVWSQGN